MSTARHHAEWLSLVEASGPFLSLPVLLQAFPKGLEAHDHDHLRRFKLAYDEWQDNQDALHRAKNSFASELKGFAAIGKDDIFINLGERNVEIDAR